MPIDIELISQQLTGEPVDAGQARPHISASQVSTMLSCPRKWEYRYVQGLILPPSGALVLGKAWHSAIETNYRQKITSEADLPLDDVTDCFSDAFEQGLQSEEVILEQPKGDMKDIGVEITRAHHTFIAPLVSPALVEQGFRLPLGDECGYDLIGFFDVVEKNGVIADNKSWGKTKSQETIDNDLQLTAYAMAYRALTGVKEAGLRIDAVIKTAKPKAVRIETSRTNSECEWYIRLIDKIVQQIKSGIFPPNPTGFLCSPKWCGYWELCKGGSTRGN